MFRARQKNDSWRLDQASVPKAWEGFTLHWIGGSKMGKKGAEWLVGIQSCHNKFVTAMSDGKFKQHDWKESWEEFTIQILYVRNTFPQECSRNVP